MSDQKDTSEPFLRRLLVAPFRIGPSARSLGEFYHQLASMLRAGLTIVRALDSLAEQTGSGRIRRCLPEMIRHISDGGNAAGAFARFPGTFDVVHVAMIRAGEQGGRLDEVLEALAEACKRRSRLIRLFITAVLYPFLLLHFAFFAVPLIESLQGADAPYWRLALPRFAVFYGVVFLLFIVPRMLRQFAPTAYALDVARGFVPVISGAREKLTTARIARSLDGLYSSGMTLAEVMPTVADACGSEIARRKLHRMAPMLADGTPLSEAMRAAGGFPATFVNMVATGEEGGQLSTMLANAAAYYEDAAETTLKRLAIIAPIVIYIAVAAYVGFQIVKAYAHFISERYEGLDQIGR